MRVLNALLLSIGIQEAVDHPDRIRKVATKAIVVHPPRIGRRLAVEYIMNFAQDGIFGAAEGPIREKLVRFLKQSFHEFRFLLRFRGKF